MIAKLLLEIDRVLSEAGIVHAFGGALALNYYADPRATTDVDVNVAKSVAEAPVLVSLLAAHGFTLDEPLEGHLPIAGLRFRRNADVVDCFLAFDGFHERLLGRAREVPINAEGGRFTTKILSQDDLAVVKLSFNRPKDHIDIDAMIAAGTPFDYELIATELVNLRGPTAYPRLARFKDALSKGGS